ncbi:MAG: M48 family metalloprotease [Acidobacteriota bacterium]
MNESKATRYQRARRRTRAAGLVSAGLVLALIALTPAARLLANAARSASAGATGLAATTLSLAIFVFLLVVVWELATLPAMIYMARRVERAYQARTALSIEEVLGAQASASIVALPAAMIVGMTVILAVAVSGRWWWMAAGLLLACFLAIALHGAPTVFAWLADVRPLARAELAARLRQLAVHAGVPIAGIDEWVVGGNASATALVIGVGRVRRVLVSSEIARQWTDDEVAVVVAHELAHHAYRDLWTSLALDVLVLSTSLLIANLAVVRLTGALAISGPADLAALPLIALVAGAVWTLATPLRHALSRRHERRADVFALALTDRAEAFGAAIRRLGARHLSEERPSAMTRWLYYRHPSVSERLALADAYQRARPAARSERL